MSRMRRLLVNMVSKIGSAKERKQLTLEIDSAQDTCKDDGTTATMCAKDQADLLSILLGLLGVLLA